MRRKERRWGRRGRVWKRGRSRRGRWLVGEIRGLGVIKIEEGKERKEEKEK